MAGCLFTQAMVRNITVLVSVRPRSLKGVRGLDIRCPRAIEFRNNSDAPRITFNNIDFGVLIQEIS
jgi:hypothetical protein